MIAISAIVRTQSCNVGSNDLTRDQQTDGNSPWGASDMTNTLQRMPGRALLVWVAGLVLLAGLGPLAAVAPIAHADANDNAFLGALTSKGIHFGTPEKAFIAGHEVCDELGNGKSPAQVASTVENNSDMDGYHAGFFVGASIRAYCPQYAS
jgi:hypothetical protein